MSDQRILYTEEMVGASHPSKSDTLNRLALVEHNTDGTHKTGLKSSFSAHKNAVDQTPFTTATWTQITFSTAEWDTNGNFASNAFTPPAGKYQLNFAVEFSKSNATGNLGASIAIYKNGILYKEGMSLNAASYAAATEIGLVGSVLVDANGTDVFTVYAVFTFTSGIITVSGAVAETYFQGCRID
ncbi:MAG: hypothetical protein HY887_04705 [Deltaproteobacteria bacterium]|nr:hypothetical protein [Deltaproteobacteria bacterium]